MRWSPLDEALPDVPPLWAVLLLAGATPSGKGNMKDAAPLARAALEAAQAGGARHVFLASSQAVYGATDAAAREDTPRTPLSGYGHSKAAMEDAALNVPAGMPPVTCLRIGNVAGAELLGQAVASGRPVRLDRFADGAGPVRSYIGVGTLARVLESLVRHSRNGTPLPQVLNVAAPTPTAMSELLRSWGRGWDWRPAPPEARQRAVMNVELLESLHRFRPEDSHATQMARDWERFGA